MGTPLSATSSVTGEDSVSNTNHLTKRPRHDSNVSASRFIGVVGQLNGHWGVQIYSNYRRFWLGTFKLEKEAARAYDSAAIKLRSGDSHRNFPWTSITAQELNFQSQFSTEAVLNMIKDGSYPSMFAEYLRVQLQTGEIEVGCNLAPVRHNGGFSCRQLFQKELTPSDVGKLNRLVIPKKNALKSFPCVSNGIEENEGGGGADDYTQLVFYDGSMRPWKFRYCYWKSSQSFVFTRGWNKFVKEKRLKANDMVIFSMCQCRDGTKEACTFFRIDYDRVEEINKHAEALHLYLGEKVVDRGKDEERAQKLDPGQNSDHAEDEKESDKEKEILGAESMDAPRKGLRLFGVQII